MSGMTMLSQLEEKLKYHFKDIKLLQQALTHTSYANEKNSEQICSNERLEYLGDAVLEMTVSHMLYQKNPPLSEGEMTRLRARLVCEQSLYERANEIDLGSYLLLGRGEQKGGGSKRPSLLADAFEALIAAIYIDGGITNAAQFVQSAFEPLVTEEFNANDDYKTILQELIQNNQGMTYSYKLIAQAGPEHNKTFTVDVLIDGVKRGSGTGKSKKAAQQAAAKEAIKFLKGA